MKYSSRVFSRPVPLLICLLAGAVFLVPGSLQAQWEISGTVVDADGDGVADVDIDISDDADTVLDLSGDLTDADGVFTLTMLDTALSGFFDIEFNPPAGEGFLDLILDDVFLAGDTDLGEIELPAGGVLSGRVIDENGDPIESIDLELFDETGTEVEFTNDNTDADGLYSVKITAGVWDVVFRQVEPGDVTYAPVRVVGIDVSGDVKLDDVTLRVGYSVIGTVEDGAGTAVSSVDIDVVDPASRQEIEAPGDFTDADGAFDVLVPAGDWKFIFTAPAMELLVPQAVLTTVAEPPAENDLGTIVLADGVEVTGTVVDEAGLGVEDADLDFFDPTTDLNIFTGNDNTDVDGAFRVVVEAGTYHLRYRPRFDTGLAPLEELDIEILEDTDLGDIVLASGFALTGNVTDGTDAVADVLVTLEDSDTGDGVYVFGNLTVALGDYALRQVSGTYDVLFTPPEGSGLSSVTRSSVELLEDTVLDVELVELPPSATGLDCVLVGDDVALSWTNGASDYAGIDVLRGGALLASLGGGDESYTDVAPGAGSFTYDVVPVRDGVEATAATCTITIEGDPPPPVVDILCTTTAADVSISWSVGADDYSDIEISRDGVLLDTLAGSATRYDDGPLDDASYTYAVTPIRANLEGTTVECTVEVDVAPEPVSSLECAIDGTSVSLTWSNGLEDYDSIDVVRDGSVIASLSGTDTSYDDLDLADGSYDYEVQPVLGGFAAPVVSCTVSIGGPRFVRGDVTNNGSVDLADPISALKWQFSDGPTPDCLVAADVNDDSRVNIADAIRALHWLFLDGPEPSSPFPDCGEDPEPDLPCDSPPDC